MRRRAIPRAQGSRNKGLSAADATPSTPRPSCLNSISPPQIVAPCPINLASLLARSPATLALVLFDLDAALQQLDREHLP